MSRATWQDNVQELNHIGGGAWGAYPSLNADESLRILQESAYFKLPC